jgi:hypothetical protein
LTAISRTIFWGRDCSERYMRQRGGYAGGGEWPVVWWCIYCVVFWWMLDQGEQTGPVRHGHTSCFVGLRIMLSYSGLGRRVKCELFTKRLSFDPECSCLFATHLSSLISFLYLQISDVSFSFFNPVFNFEFKMIETYGVFVSVIGNIF